MKNTKKTLVLILLLSMGVLLPSILVSAREEPIRIASSPGYDFVDNSKTMPNGFIKVDWEMKSDWYYSGEMIGYAQQYVTGIQRTDGKATLRGYGVFYSTHSDVSGTLTYTIGNNWDMVSNEIWAFRMHILGGTEDFEGIKGTAKAEFPDFLMYLNKNPWELL